ncbi:Uncharacterized protein C3F10.06c at N-terminal half [Coccomyxa sp. Obi]|nr:Uncharacterized protein C3F10.06c at N-terminal half [Coccomyxa sp. Obi]
MAVGAANDSTIQFSVQPSVNRLLRQLKRQEVGLYNCINSVIDDVLFVKEIANIYPSLSLVANLRCGLWYAPDCAGTCYFKSTDGHYGNWGFSYTRLNLHIAHLAASQSGCLIVDATRRGKTFPDAFTKTTPIWAAVLNRAIGLVRKQHSTDAGATHGLSTAEDECYWDTELHVPPWISANEANQISMRLDGWAQQLLQVGADVAGLAAVLKKPLRPLWLSQRSHIWLNEVAHPADLPFTPLILISASLPDARQRRIARVGKTDEGGWTFEYVPGAGDDEESWARGLTPQLLWAHKEELVSAGPEGVHEVVRRIVCEGAAEATQQEEAGPARQLPGSFLPGAPNARPAEGGLHNLAPVGARGCRSASPHCTGNGLYWIGGTGIAVGSWGAGKAPDVWSHADAVLCLATHEHPSMQGEAKTGIHLRRPRAAAPVRPGDIVDCYEITGATDPAERPVITRYLHLPIRDAKHARRDLQAHLPAALQFLSHHLGCKRRVLIHDTDGLDVCVCVALALLIACFTSKPPDSSSAGAACSAANLEFCKVYRPPPSNPAPPAKQAGTACSSQDRKQHDVCQERDVGEPQHVSNVTIPADAAEANDLAPVDSTKFADVCISAQPQGSGEVAAEVTKGEVRQRLALVSGYYPSARPTRGCLKQVYNFFQQEKLLCEGL